MSTTFTDDHLLHDMNELRRFLAMIIVMGLVRYSWTVG